MSQGFEIQLLLATTRALFHVGRHLGGASGEGATHERHLLRRQTQISDGQLLRQTLRQLDLDVREGDPEGMWGGEIELQVRDEEGQPWFALGWDEATKAYVIYSQDPAQAQEELPEEARLSDRDPMPVLGRVAQQYGYLKTLRALLQEGFEAQGAAQRQADGSQVLVLRKHDPERDEEHTVRLVFRDEAGEATILTDSRKADGKHGVCPDVDRVLGSIGIEEYDKWTAPVAKKAMASAGEESARRSDRRASPASRQRKGTQ
jgi:hypothetical protein